MEVFQNKMGLFQNYNNRNGRTEKEKENFRITNKINAIGDGLAHTAKQVKNWQDVLGENGMNRSPMTR